MKEFTKGQSSESAQNLQGKANEVMNMALTNVKNGATGMEPPTNGGVMTNDGITDDFKGIPMRELISAPLIAAAEAQQELASTAWDFYQRIAFDKDKKTRVLEFEVDRPIEQNGIITTMKQKVEAPFIGLVPIPSLLIDHVDVDFQMEVTTTENTKSTLTTDVAANLSSNWFVKTEISGKVSTSRENTRATNQTAKYQIHVTASQQPQTEGLSKLMDIMASCVEPITDKGQ